MQLPAARVHQVRKPLRERIQVFPFHAGVIPCREAQLMGTIVTPSEREEKQHRKPQMPAVVESCLHSMLPSLTADCITAQW